MGVVWGIRAAAVVALLALLPLARVLELPEAKVLVPGAVAVVGLYLLLERQVVRALWRKLADAPSDELLAVLGSVSAGDPQMTARLTFHKAALLSREWKYAEARTLLEPLLESPFAAAMKPAVQNGLAWALMHLGVTKRALELSAEALRQGERPCVYAIGLYLDGRAAEAVPRIEQALADHAADGPPAQAIRAFYLGEALEQLGRREEARSAFERAVREAPESRWAEQARAKLG